MHGWKKLLIGLPVLFGMAAGAQADTTLWRVGLEDNSKAEFTATANPSTYTIPAGWSTQTTWPEWEGRSDGHNAIGIDKNLDCTITYSLGSQPTNGAEFQFKTIDASRHVPELAVFSNGYLCGVIEMMGTGYYTPTQHEGAFGDLFKVYIPKEFLQVGTNTIRIKKLQHPFASAGTDRMTGTSFMYLSFDYDYFKLNSLSSPAGEPLNSRYVNMGALTQTEAPFTINANTVTYNPLVLKWLGLAYSGNIQRVAYWSNLGAGTQPSKLENLQMLRDYNFQTLVDYYSHGADSDVDANGVLISTVKTKFDTFFANYGQYINYYELSNEPTMSFSNESFKAQKAIADYVNQIKGPHTKVTAPGYNYGFQSSGSPGGWDAVDANRIDLETRCQATNGHSYGRSYMSTFGSGTNSRTSFFETLDTYGRTQTNGMPKEFVTSEYGTPDGVGQEFTDISFSENNPQTIDRILRAHIGYGSKFNCYAAEQDADEFYMFNGTFTDPTTWTAHLDPNGTAGQTTRLKIFRQYALAYATHGKPLAYTYLNPAAVQNHLAYFRAVDTSTLPSIPGSGAKSDKILLNFVNFDKVSQTMNVRVTMPINGTYSGERFGSEASYSAARTTVSFTAAPTIDLNVTLGPRESVQYILTKPIPLRDPENPANTVAGIDYKYYEGTWSSLPDFTALTPVKTGTLANFSLSPKNVSDHFGFVYSGFINVPTNGLYTFYTNSDDGSKFYIGTTEVVNNDGSHAAQEREGSIGLKAGKHAFKVVYFDGTSTEGLNVSWAGPGLTKQLVPDGNLFRDNLTAGLIGWWKLDESSGTTAADSSGNGKTGTLSNVTWNPSSGKIAGSASFNASTSRIELPDSTVKNAGTALTFACWFKTSASGVIVGVNNTHYPTTPTNWCPMLYVGTNGKLLGKIWDGLGTYIMSPNTVNNGAWHHAALVASGPNQSLYLDGALVGSLTGNNFAIGSNTINQLGVGYTPGWWAGNGTWMLYGGQLDDVRLYNRTLSAGEVATLAAP